MNDRRMRSRTRAVRRLAEFRSCEEDETDTSTSDHNNGSPPPPRHGGGRCRGGGGYCSDSATYNHTVPRLPPIGVFWDIENCQIPRGKSAVAVAQAIRDQFFSGYRESEFIVVCDVKREIPQVIQELDNAQVNVIHVGSQSKNAADEKLRQSIRRFADIHGSRSAIVLISGDINFAPDLCDLRHRKKIHVILVHKDNCSESLIISANETYSYNELVAGLPLRGAVKANQQGELTVSGLPFQHDPGKVRMRLKRLAENCGGRVGMVTGTEAILRFPSMEFAMRAQKRMDGEDVFGSKIAVSHPSIVDSRRPFNDQSPTKAFNRRIFTNGLKNEDRKYPPKFEDPRSLWKNIPPFHDPNSLNHGRFKQPLPMAPFFNQENVPVNSELSNMSSENVLNKKPSCRRPILGRQQWSSFSYESKTNEGYSNGRHSLDSMLDFEVGRETYEREKRSDEDFEIWLRNSTSNLGERKCRTPSPTNVLGVNTSIPPPPIVNLPRRNDSNYFFHPIDTNSALTNGHSQSSPSSSASSVQDSMEMGRCFLHSKVQSVDSSLVKVTVRLSDFSARLMALVTSHDNRLPLSSLRDCYEAQFGAIVSDCRGVCMEHLVTCVCSVELVKSAQGKVIRLTTNVSPAFSDPPLTEAPLAKFSKEIQDLLKNQPECKLDFDRVVPAYIHLFGRHCRLADYGCTRLVELLGKLPHVVQIVGEGADRVVTLTHRTQMRRFTADLTRVLRSQNGKQLTLSELPGLWINTLGRALQPTEYGLCFLEDLLDQVPASNAVVVGETVSLPRKPQPEQAQRFKQFTEQVVDLLSTTSNFAIEFSKFCPAYHHHFGIQCKLSDFGFTKLAELFQAIPHIVKIEGEMEGSRWLSLTTSERLKVLSKRVLLLVQPRCPPGLYIDALLCAYLWQYGHALRPENFNCNSSLELINKLTSVKIVTTAEGVPIIIPAVKESNGTNKIATDQKNSCSQPMAEEREVESPNRVKTNGAVSTTSSALLDFLKKAQNCSTIENGVNNAEQYNQIQPVVAQEPAITLLTPAQFLLPRPNSESPTTRNLFPSSPDPSALPKPVGLTFSPVKNGFDIGNKLLEDLDLNEQNRHKQRLKLAPHFCSPLQLN